MIGALKVTQTNGQSVTTAPRQLLEIACAGSASSPSPVHGLHRAVELAFAAEPEVVKWPGSVRLAVLLLGMTLPWAGLAIVLRRLLN